MLAMSSEATLILLGSIVALLPFIGLPYTFLMVILPVLGIVVAIIAIRLRARRMMTRVPAPLEVHEEETASAE
jgi:hypothetical protein